MMLFTILKTHIYYNYRMSGPELVLQIGARLELHFRNGPRHRSAFSLVSLWLNIHILPRRLEFGEETKVIQDLILPGA